jgi:hypothetical protein
VVRRRAHGIPAGAVKVVAHPGLGGRKIRPQLDFLGSMSCETRKRPGLMRRQREA